MATRQNVCATIIVLNIFIENENFKCCIQFLKCCPHATFKTFRHQFDYVSIVCNTEFIVKYSEI